MKTSNSESEVESEWKGTLYFKGGMGRYRTPSGLWHTLQGFASKENVRIFCNRNGIRFVDWEEAEFAR